MKHRIPDVQKRLEYNTKAYEATKEALRLREAGDEKGAKKAEGEALKWLKKLRDEESGR